ncbi:unnamed protein product [Linum trigynum]|uniref:Uncharacterized protein n=1 Tax=Linum trigynum TaxID=586398 RepID=A0AAV2FD93_9ROSI
MAWSCVFKSLQLNKLEMAELLFLIWRIWKARCWSCYDRVQYLPGLLFQQILHQRDEWIAATALGSHGRNLSGRSPSTTPSPSCPSGGLLVRFDGATSREVGGSIGFVGFSASATIVHAYGKYYDGLFEPFLLELLAL